MSWILGFGTPIAYLTATLYVLRATYRSMYKRNKTGRWDDWPLVLFCMAWIWPILAPVYFPWVSFTKRHNDTNFFEWFFKRNLPESDRDKRNREYDEKQAMQRRIRDLEQELGIGV